MIVLRSALFNLLFFGATFVLALTGTLLRPFSAAATWAVVRFWAHTIVALARTICGIRVEVTGREHIPAGAALIASHHESALDTLVWLSLVPAACYVLKRELRSIPLFGSLAAATGMIVVDREGGAGAMRGLMKAADQAVQAGRQIVIFPEGTRAPARTLLPLQPGIAALASRTGLPVIPVATNSGDCWGRRAFHKYPGVVRIVIRPPLPARLPRDQLMQALTRQMDMRWQAGE